MATFIDSMPIAFRLGQIDALAQVLLASSAQYSPKMRHSFALRALSRAWAQYRKDRAISFGANLVGAESSTERDAFLILLEHALPPGEALLASAIRSVRVIAIRPMREEAEQTANLVAASAPDLDVVMGALTNAALPQDPLARLLALATRVRYSRGDAVATSDALAATALSPCWAINLAATVRSAAFHLGHSALPCPGIVSRALFRADRDADQHRDAANESLLEALHQTACDIARIPRAAEIFAKTFPNQRSTSRLFPAWMLLFGLGGLTPAQLARALPATKAGAGKLLRQLEAARLCRSAGAFEPFVCSLKIPIKLQSPGFDGGYE